MRKKIRWGILGCGKIANKFADDLKLSQSGELIACASRNLQQAKEFANKFNLSYYFDNYTQLVQCIDVDIIYIATPHSFHFDHTLLSLLNKKAVLCEKPMGISEPEVNIMIQTAKEHQLLLMEAMWTAFLPAIMQVEAMVKEGQIGLVRHLSADFGFKSIYDAKSRLFNKSLAGGSLLDIGIYPLFISILMLGYPENIVAYSNKSNTDVDIDCTILLRFANGATASLYSSLLCHTDTKCEIIGTEGKILIPGRFHEQEYFMITKNNEPTSTIHCGRKGKGYLYEIEHMNDCLLNGKTESNIMTFEKSILLIRLMDEIKRQIGLCYTTSSSGS